MADEFRKDMSFERIREKFRQGVAQGERDDAFRGRHGCPDRAQPRAEDSPDGRRVKDGVSDGLQRARAMRIKTTADGVDGLLEGDLDLEAYAVEPDDLHRRERQVGAEQDLPSARGVDDQHEADGDADGAPVQVEREEADRDAALAVDGARRLRERALAVEEFFQRDLLAVGAASAARAGLRRFRRAVGDGVGADGRDQVPAALSSGPMTFAAAK